ncbi:MAG: hypothetical protein WC467_03440 [Patescibacteria group bacterium]
MIRIIYKGQDKDILKHKVLKAFNDTSKVFKDNLANVTVYIFPSRKEFNHYIGEETETWIIANASPNNEIAILSPVALKRDSIHSSREFLPVLKHEFAHLFVNKLANGKTVPKWLDEGLAQYVAKQYKDAEYAVKKAENDFCKKLATKSDWNKRVDRQAYQVAALFVNYLINKYSFQKVKELLTLLDKEYYYTSFKKEFFKVYKISLSEVEREFVKGINSHNKNK